MPRGAYSSFQANVAVVCAVLLASTLGTNGAGFDVQLVQQSGAGYVSTPLSTSWNIKEGNRLLGSGTTLAFKKTNTLESQLPVTVLVYTNENIQDGWMNYRDMHVDFNKGAVHCTKTRNENPFSFIATTTCHFDHE